MEVILLESINKLGRIGDIVSVKPGFARNFLIPGHKALRATDANKKKFEERREQIESENKNRMEKAQAVADKLDGQTITLVRQAGDSGHLYGSVSGRDVALELNDKGFANITVHHVMLDHPIKELGVYDIHLRPHSDVGVTITAYVVRSLEEVEKLKSARTAVEEANKAEPSEAKPVTEAEKKDEAIEEKGLTDDAVASETITQESEESS